MRLDLLEELSRRRALSRILGEEAVHEVVDPERDVGQGRQLGSWSLDLIREDLDRCLRAEQGLTRQGLEGRRAEGVEVGRGRPGVAQEDLGREVGGRAHQGPASGQASLGRLVEGDPEVGQLDLTLRGQDQVSGLYVAVNDPLLMGDPQGLSAALEDHEDLVAAQLVSGARVEDLAQIAPLDELHHEVGPPGPLVLAAVQEPHDGGVVEANEHVALALEARPDGLVVDRGAQDLEGHCLAARAARHEHRGHSAFAEALFNGVGADLDARVSTRRFFVLAGRVWG